MEIDDLPDKELVKLLLKGLGNISKSSGVRWSLVSNIIGTGATTSTQICNKYGINPHEEIGHDKCSDCELIEDII